MRRTNSTSAGSVGSLDDRRCRAAQRWLGQSGPGETLIHPLVMERIVAGAEITDEALRGRASRHGAPPPSSSALFGEVDVLALPVAACSGTRWRRALDVAGKAEDVSTLVTRYTPLASVSGLPRLSFPAARTTTACRSASSSSPPARKRRSASRGRLPCPPGDRVARARPERGTRARTRLPITADPPQATSQRTL